jgi:hypothetical protein
MKKSLLFYLVILLVTFGVSITEGASTTYRHQDQVTTIRGDAIGGASVAVYLDGTSTLATLYSGASTGTSTISNPTYTDTYGRFFFYASPGVYDLTISGTNVVTYTIEDVVVAGPPTSGVFDVTTYGAVGDGLTDDAAAIQAAIDACEAAGGGKILVPPGEYSTESTISVTHSGTERQVEIMAYGATITAPSGLSGPILEIGADDASTLNVIVNGGHWGMSSRDWSGTIGISLKSANRCCLRDVIVENCAIGIQLAGRDGRGCAYNNIFPLRIVDCLNAIYLTADTDGWTNSNNFYGGSIQYTTSVDTVDCSAGTSINIETPTEGEHILNDNHFYGQKMEISSSHSAGKPVAVKVFGEYNSFINQRIERYTSPLYYGISGTISPTTSYNAQYNTITTGYPGSGNHNLSQVIKDDTGAELTAFNTFCGREVGLTGGSTTYPVLGLRAASTGYRGLEIYQSASSTPTFSIYGGGAFTTAPQAEPASPEEGMIYYDSTANKLMFYNGSAWETVTSSP